jgi:hypothetical protein
VAVTGLPHGATLVLQDNGADNLTVTADGPSSFTDAVPVGRNYDVSVQMNSSGLPCTPINPTGVASAYPEGIVVNVTCGFFLYAHVTGLVDAGEAGIMLFDDVDGSMPLHVSEAGTFAFYPALVPGTTYAVSEPSAIYPTCTIPIATGMITDASASVNVLCP